MDRHRWQKASRHLDRALELPPAERDGCIALLRAEDPESAADVEALLAEHRQLSAEGFLDTAAPIRKPEPEMSGVVIGAYTLVSPIGHGGMGSVWLAERSDGRFEAKAAVKLLNPALVGRAGEARFKREGNILARLTHPHIGRLIDAGVTTARQPYLVLEYVDGRHIDRYCDEEKLSVEDRIRLFLDVQSAVAHAHTNLIVHRDLKPSNVLVTAGGQVKLLDFGIAKLLEGDAPVDSSSLLTVEGGHVLTPKYAAPEQVLGGRITTATDVYALGVLLFEMLSGRHPTGVDARSPADFARAITEIEPTRLSATLREPLDPNAALTLAVNRATTPDRLQRTLRGDLDTILGKALKKNPAERYGSVAEFADDLRRFLDHLPISARPDSLNYRTAKFMRRHWRSLAATAAMLALIVGLTAFYTVRITAERDRARLEADKASKIGELLAGLLTGADPYRTPDAKEPTVQSLLDIGAERIARDLRDRPELQAEMFSVIGRTYERMGLHEKALPLQQRALEISRSTPGFDPVRLAQTLNNLGVLYREQGNVSASEPLLRESLLLRRRVLGAEHQDVAITLVELSRALVDSGRAADAEPYSREALAIRRKVFGDEHRETATSKSDLGRLLLQRGELADAETLLRENMATVLRTLGPDHPNTAAAKRSFALLLMAKGDPVGAEALARQTMDVQGRVLGPLHPDYASAIATVATSLELQGRLDEAQTLADDALRIARSRLGDQHPGVLGMVVNVARIQIARGNGAATESSLREVLDVRQRLYPSGEWRIAQAQSLLGAALLAGRRYDEAEPLMLAADRSLRTIPGTEGRERAANRERLVTLYRATGRSSQADAYR
ncbi:MAG TPA: serine/threonine-protein kinase [Vicinamibacterales bacterium]